LVLAALAALPPTTATWEYIFNWYLIFGTGASVVTITLLVFFSLRYRNRGPQSADQVHKGGPTWKLALLTGLITLSVLTGAEYQTFAGVGNVAIPNDPNALTIRVNGFQWGWNFTYPNGYHVTGNLTVPSGRTIILNITSRDVFHSFGVTGLAIKSDSIPGKENQAWFMSPTAATYTIRCFELCGVGHALMTATLNIVNPQAFDAWYGRLVK
jgi:cytochrome c oxidase subunit 2